MAEGANAFDSLFNFGNKKTNPPPAKNNTEKQKKKPKDAKLKKRQDSVDKTNRKHSSNQANEDAQAANGKGVVNKTTTRVDGDDSEWETDDVLVEILVAAEQRRSEPLSAQNMAVDVFGKTPPPTLEYPAKLM